MSKIICPISGIELYKSDYMLGFHSYTLEDTHPIFKAKKSLILTVDILHRFQSAPSWIEKKLYYLAVINTTELVEFRVPAYPEPYTMEYTFEQLCKLAKWIDYARYGIPERLVFPRYLVTTDNNKLQNISSWISALYDIRNIWTEKLKDEDLKREINESSARIEMEFRNASIIGQAFTRPLAKWALEIADCPENKFQEYLHLLQTPLTEAWCLDYKLVREVRELLQEELPVTNDQAIAVLHQAKLLYEASIRGLSNLEQSEENENDEDSNSLSMSVDTSKPMRDGSKNRPYKIKPSNISFEIINEEPILNLQDLPPEPQRADYPKPFQYLQAKAKWDLLKSATEKPKRQYGQF